MRHSFRPIDHSSMLYTSPSLEKIPSSIPKTILPTIINKTIEIPLTIEKNNFLKQSSQTSDAETLYENTRPIGMDGIYLKQIDNLQDRLLESEKIQRNTMLEMNRLQGNINETFRSQESATREETNRHRVHDEQLAYLKDMMRIQQDQLHHLMNQQSLNKEAMMKIMEFTKQKIGQQESLSFEIQNRMQQEMTQSLALFKELGAIRQELSHLRMNMDDKYENAVKNSEILKNEVSEISIDHVKMKTQLNILDMYLSRLDQRLSSSAHTADRNLVKVGKVLFDFSTVLKDFEDDQRRQLRIEFEARLQQSLNYIKDEEMARREEVKEKYQDLMGHLDQERRMMQGMERLMMGQMEEKISTLSEWTRGQIRLLSECKTTENEEMIKTVTVLKNVIMSKRTKDQERYNDFTRMIDEVNAEIERIKMELLDSTKDGCVMGGKMKRSQKNQQKSFGKKHKTFQPSLSIQPGTQGILIMHHLKKESSARRECLNLFQHYHDLTLETCQDSINIEDAFDKEISSLNKPEFKMISLDMECMIFCQTPSDPIALVNQIFSDLVQDKQQQTRYTCRLIPIQETCHTSVTDILQMASKLFAPIFHSPNQSKFTFAVIPKIRNNSKINRDEIIQKLAALVGPNHTVDLSTPEYCIIIEIFKNVAGISIVKDFYKFKKYNLESVKENTLKQDIPNLQ